MKPTIYLGGDHAAFELKEKITAYLKTRGYIVRDFGPHTYDPDDDYPDFVIPMAKAVGRAGPLLNPPLKKGRKKVEVRGMALGGSGIGECIAANKVKGVRAVRAWDKVSAKMSRWHNDTNVLCLGGGKTMDKTQNVGLTFAQAKPIIDTWLTTPFSNAPRHVRRLKKISRIDK
ncbi:RpiB/LacA/LacB family sugar-phosphate isomerase [Candidatus Uhrbacteria bacterium]|nr:RpiB/LacA/LacB family sugar-phosphate isomerase [Candidatus Uhrbacteria bacterium]